MRFRIKGRQGGIELANVSQVDRGSGVVQGFGRGKGGDRNGEGGQGHVMPDACVVDIFYERCSFSDCKNHAVELCQCRCKCFRFFGFALSRIVGFVSLLPIWSLSLMINKSVK